MSLIDQNHHKTIELMNAENKRNHDAGSGRLIEKMDKIKPLKKRLK